MAKMDQPARLWNDPHSDACSVCVCLWRVQSILEDGAYITAEHARAQGAKRQSLVIFHRKIGRAEPVLYHITDQPPAKRSHDWNRIAAVFVTGAAWQFKDYPFKVAALPAYLWCPMS